MATSRLCSIPDCDKRAFGRGWCQSHYYRWLKHDDPLGGRVRNGEALRWIEKHISHSGLECLPYPFQRDRAGYGLLNLPGMSQGAARYMCRRAHGEPPSPAHQAAHSCGKGHEGCTNPKHLSWKTPPANQADRLIHGTHIRGPRNPGVKLTETAVRQIRGLKGVLSQSKLAKQFGVTRFAIHAIHTGKKWGWLA